MNCKTFQADNIIQELENAGVYEIVSYISEMSRNTIRYIEFVIREYMNKFFTKRRRYKLVFDNNHKTYLKNMRYYIKHSYSKDIFTISKRYKTKWLVEIFLHNICGINRNVYAICSLFTPNCNNNFFRINTTLELTVVLIEGQPCIKILYQRNISLFVNLPQEYILENFCLYSNNEFKLVAATTRWTNTNLTFEINSLKDLLNQLTESKALLPSYGDYNILLQTLIIKLTIDSI